MSDQTNSNPSSSIEKLEEGDRAIEVKVNGNDSKTEVLEALNRVKGGPARITIIPPKESRGFSETKVLNFLNLSDIAVNGSTVTVSGSGKDDPKQAFVAQLNTYGRTLKIENPGLSAIKAEKEEAERQKTEAQYRPISFHVNGSLRHNRTLSEVRQELASKNIGNQDSVSIKFEPDRGISFADTTTIQGLTDLEVVPGNNSSGSWLNDSFTYDLHLLDSNYNTVFKIADIGNNVGNLTIEKQRPEEPVVKPT